MFKLKSHMLQMLQTFEKFEELHFEDPHLHLKSYVGVSDSFRVQGSTRNESD